MADDGDPNSRCGVGGAGKDSDVPVRDRGCAQGTEPRLQAHQWPMPLKRMRVLSAWGSILLLVWGERVPPRQSAARRDVPHRLPARRPALGWSRRARRGQADPRVSLSKATRSRSEDPLPPMPPGFRGHGQRTHSGLRDNHVHLLRQRDRSASYPARAPPAAEGRTELEKCRRGTNAGGEQGGEPVPGHTEPRLLVCPARAQRRALGP